MNRMMIVCIKTIQTICIWVYNNTYRYYDYVHRLQEYVIYSVLATRSVQAGGN